MLQLKQLNTGNRAEWLVEKRYTFGKGPDNNYCVDGAGVIDVHAGLEVSGDEVQLFNLGGGECVKVNGASLAKNQKLLPGDVFSIGDAQFKIEDPKQSRKPKPAVDPALIGWTLKAKNTALANKSFPIEGSQTIGRSKECDICLNVVHLSRRHAKITVKDTHLQLEDLKSSNGTFLNGRRIESAQIKSGDEIGFDTLKFSVIGPATSLEKTQIRQEPVDSDATTMRPMINPSELVGQNKGSAPKKKPRSHITSAPITVDNTIEPPPSEVEAENKAGKPLFVVILVLIAIAATYIFLS